MSNATGTLLRIFGLISLLLFAWFGVVFLVYFVASLLSSFTFSFSVWMMLVIALLIIKAFYPKNVFR